MRHISHRSGIGTLLFLMVSTVGCGLLLAGCGPKLPDSGSLDPVEVRKETPFYLDVSAEMVQEQGICADGLAAAIEKRLLTVDGMKPADKPGPGALTVRVDVRDVYRPGRTRKNYLKSAGAAIALATLGTVGGAVTGAFSAPTVPTRPRAPPSAASSARQRGRRRASSAAGPSGSRKRSGPSGPAWAWPGTSSRKSWKRSS